MRILRIIAFDQSTVAVGFAVMNNEPLHLIVSGSKRFDTKEYKGYDLHDRIIEIKKYINILIEEYNPEIFAIENVQRQLNTKTYGTLSGLLFVIINMFKEKEYLFYIVEPTKWKSFCGIKGRKRKEQKKNTIEKFSKKYNKEITEDESDAIGMCEYVCSESLKIEKV